MPRWETVLTVPPDDRDGTGGIKFEDGGMAAIMYAPLGEEVETGGDGHFFVRLHSWHTEGLEGMTKAERMAKGHTLFRALMGRRVRIIVETVDDDLVEPGGSLPPPG